MRRQSTRSAIEAPRRAARAGSLEDPRRGEPGVDRAAAVAHDVRAMLLRFDETPRDLAGQCGLAAMLLVAVLGDLRALRTGFYMRRQKLFGRCGRYPSRHAWCRVDATIVDATATQFGRGNAAVHVARFDEDARYVETAIGRSALADIMYNWRGRELPAYVRIAEHLRSGSREEVTPSMLFGPATNGSPACA